MKYVWWLLCCFFIAPVWAAPGDIIFSDDFESGSLAPNWSTSDAFAAGINDDTSNSGTESLFLRWRAVSVRSLALDLNVPEAELSFWWRRGSNSFSNRPEGQENLVVEYLNSSNSWIELDSFQGGGQQGESATETYALPADALYLGGAIRFRFTGGSGQDFDYWHVDDVVITETGTPPSLYCTEAGVIFCDEFERALLGSDWSVSGSGNVLITTATASSGNSSMSTFGGRPESTLRTLDLSSYASVTLDYWWARGNDAWTPSEDPDNNEDLVLEYRTGFGSWVELDRLTGNGQPGFSESRQLTLPAGALAANFQLRFRQTDGNNGAFDYFHIDDVRLVAGTALQCFFDDFNRGNLGDDWVTSAVAGGFAPQIVNSRLRLTQDRNNQSTAASLQRLFPADSNIVTIEYDHYAWSTLGGSGADGIAVVFSDAAITPQPGGFGGSLGYGQLSGSNDGFAGGWVGIGIDEYGNFANPTEGRQGGIGRTPDSVTLRGSGVGQAGYRFIANSGGLSPGIDQRNAPANVGGPNHRYRFVIDARTNGQTWVTVQRNTGSGFINVIGPVDVETQPGQAAIPTELLLSFTGSTGGSRNVHEIDNLEVCAADLEPIGALVHHFEFYYSGNGLTCTPKDSILIRACANADCSALFTDPVEVTLGPSGWVGGDTFTINNGEATVSLAVTTPSTVGLEVISSDPTTQAFTQNLCSINGGALTTDCSLSFLDSGLLVTVPNMTANLPVTATIAAVATATDTKACIPAFGNVDKTVAFWSGYVNPNTGTLPIQLEDGSVFSDISDNEAAPTNVTLRFDGTGEAKIRLNYQDAGLMSLSARYTGSGDDAGLVMDGSDQFVSVPAGFCITTDDSCAAADSSCPVSVSAGENFAVTITPVAYDGNTDYCSGNGITENFASFMTLSHSLIAPSGGAPGTLSPVSYGHSLGGALTLNDVRISEVGVFQLDTAIDGGSYLGVDVSPGSSFEPGVTSLPFGRQIPYRFVTSVNPGELAPTCGGFSYIGEPLSWLTPPSIALTAVNAQGDTTVNYSFTGFNRLDVGDFEPETIGNDNSNVGTDGNALAVSETFNAGVLNAIGTAPSGRFEYVFSDTDTINYNKSLLAKVAPFNPDITITLDDFRDEDDINDATGHTRPISDLSFNPQANFEMRYGRLWLEDTYGPETQNLAMPMRTEFFSAAGRFEQNIDDSCTVFASTSAALAPAGFTSLQATAGTLVTGRDATAFILNASTPNQGSVDVTYDAATVLPWLQDDYDGDGSLDNPSGTATFGIYRGHDRVIYWREVP
jgi:MSHA biogenesis protein MshQ